MSHPLSHEFEAMYTIIGLMTRSPDDVDRQWPSIATLAVIDLLDEYWEMVESGESEDDEDLPTRLIDSIYEVLHQIIVHEEMPMTDEQRTAIEDQEVAALRNQIEEFSKENGLDVKLVNLDQMIEQALKDGLKGKEEEK